jgi:hypothetical protein
MGFAFMAIGDFGDLPSAGAGSDRIATRFPFRWRFWCWRLGKRGRHLPGRVRRFHEGAHNHRGNGAQRDVDRYRLRHHDHTRFRGSLGLLGVYDLGGIVFILTRGNHRANTQWLG